MLEPKGMALNYITWDISIEWIRLGPKTSQVHHATSELEAGAVEKKNANGGAVLIFWDVGFVGLLLGGAGGLGGERSGDAELNGDRGGAFVGLLRLIITRSLCSRLCRFIAQWQRRRG